MSNDYGSIPRANRDVIGNPTASHSTTKNAPTLSFCEASEDGIDCHLPADHTYTTTEGISRQVCDEHFRKLLRLIAAFHFMRAGYGVLCDEEDMSA